MVLFSFQICTPSIRICVRNTANVTVPFRTLSVSVPSHRPGTGTPQFPFSALKVWQVRIRRMQTMCDVGQQMLATVHCLTSDPYAVSLTFLMFIHINIICKIMLICIHHRCVIITIQSIPPLLPAPMIYSYVNESLPCFPLHRRCVLKTSFVCQLSHHIIQAHTHPTIPNGIPSLPPSLRQPPSHPDRLEELGQWQPRTVQVAGTRWDQSSADVAIAGLGWVGVGLKGETSLRVWTYEGVAVTTREAMVLDYAAVFERPGFTAGKGGGGGETGVTKGGDEEGSGVGERGGGAGSGRGSKVYVGKFSGGIREESRQRSRGTRPSAVGKN